MEPLPYYKWHWRDYRANRRVQRMSWQARGFYRELLDEFWAEGSLPLDHVELAEICGCTLEEFETYWPQMEGCWEATADGFVNAKMDSMRTATDSTRVTNAKSGRAGAIAKLANAGDPLANAKPTLATAKRTSGERHIAEQSRAEHKQSKAETSLRQAQSDPRHVPFKLAIQTYQTFKGYTFAWDQSDAKQLSLLLKAVPTLTLAIFQQCLNHRARSPGVPHGERPRVWLPHILKYETERLNEFGKTGAGNGNRNSKTGGNIDAARGALAILAEAERNSSLADEMQSEAGGGGESGDLSHLRTGSIEL